MPAVGGVPAPEVRPPEPGALTTAALIGLALVAGTAMSTWQAIRATRAGTLAGQKEREAQNAAAESKAVLEFLVHDLLGASDPEKALGRDLKVSDVLANAEKKITTAFPDQPLVEAGVRQALAQCYSSLGQYDVARRHASRSYQLRRDLMGPEQPETLTSMHILANVLWQMGSTDDKETQKKVEASKLWEQTLEIRRRILGPEHPDTLMTMGNLGVVLMAQGKLDEARKLDEQTLEIRHRIRGPEHPDTLNAMGNLGAVLMAQGKLDEARKLHEQTLEIQRRILGPEHPDTLISMENVVYELSVQGKKDEFRALLEQLLEIRRRVLGPGHPDTRRSRFNLVVLILNTLDRPTADRTRALELTREWRGLHPDDQHSWKWLGVAEYCNGNWDAAIQATERCIKVRRDNGWAFQWIVLAVSHARRGEMDQAREWYAKARPAINAGKGGLIDTPRWLVDEAVSLLGVAPTQGEAKPKTVPETTRSPK